MDSADTERPSDNASRWAPWWVYVAVLVGANWLRQYILPFGVLPEIADGGLALALAAVLFVIITAIHRGRRRRS